MNWLHHINNEQIGWIISAGLFAGALLLVWNSHRQVGKNLFDEEVRRDSEEGQ